MAASRTTLEKDQNRMKTDSPHDEELDHDGEITRDVGCRIAAESPKMRVAA